MTFDKFDPVRARLQVHIVQTKQQVAGDRMEVQQESKIEAAPPWKLAANASTRLEIERGLSPQTLRAHEDGCSLPRHRQLVHRGLSSEPQSGSDVGGASPHCHSGLPLPGDLAVVVKAEGRDDDLCKAAVLNTVAGCTSLSTCDGCGEGPCSLEAAECDWLCIQRNPGCLQVRDHCADVSAARRWSRHRCAKVGEHLSASAPSPRSSRN
mmetsp:Transcript_3957/g.9636  ORF Transcript_3957/g.9636 Transcript_3957/m.9636 type:complete len:209 (+) Transcript_3957:569-1195(+)